LNFSFCFSSTPIIPRARHKTLGPAIPGCVVCNVMGKAHAEPLYAKLSCFASIISEKTKK